MPIIHITGRSTGDRCCGSELHHSNSGTRLTLNYVITYVQNNVGDDCYNVTGAFKCHYNISCIINVLD